MLHAYLMYGFPTQTEQETIDSLEMVRQLFETGVLQSAFWHLFTMTAHSPVGLDPDKYKVIKQTKEIGTFANNDIVHIDPTGAEHELFGYGLKKALLNYMHGACFDFPLHKWFDFKTPKTTVAPNYIATALQTPDYNSATNYKVIWLGGNPVSTIVQRSNKGNQWEEMNLLFQTTTASLNISVDPAKGSWLLELLQKTAVTETAGMTYAAVKDSDEAAGLEDFELFWDNKPVTTLYKAGLLRI
jgi:hypothetical protein